MTKLSLAEPSQIYMAHVFDHHKVSIGWIPANSQWRNLRKACATQIFAPQRLDATEALRLAKVQDLLEHVNQSCKSGAPIDIGQVDFTTVLNSISNTLSLLTWPNMTQICPKSSGILCVV